MFNGAGIYDEHATSVRKSTQARLIAIIVIDGKDGDGFAVQGGLSEILMMPERLRFMANQIDRTIKESGGTPSDPSKISWNLRVVEKPTKG